MSLCQYCDEQRVARGYWGVAAVSLCARHVEMHGPDFDRVVDLAPEELEKEKRELGGSER